MKTAIIIYIITQLVTNAYGLAVIESVRPFVEKKLQDRGYHKNKNSLYRFNNTLSNVLKGFIPFYYFAKAIGIVTKKGDYEKQIEHEISSKNYITKEDEIINDNIDSDIIEEDKTNSIFKGKIQEFEKPDKYVAYNNFENYFGTYEEDIDYSTRISDQEDEIEITPFINKDLNQTPIIKIEEVKNIVKEEKEISNKDLAKRICDLDLEDLAALKEQIVKLENLKIKNKKLKLEKDVA